MSFHIVHKDITKMNTDAIVNAANSALKMGGGVCGAIFRAAGIKELQNECDTIGGCAVGHAVITRGYGLKAQYVIHAVGPIWRGGTFKEKEHLYSAYIESLKLAKSKGLTSISFPLISSGIYGYPKRQALNVALCAVKDFLEDSDMEVYLAIFDRKDVELGDNLCGGLRHYIDDHYENLQYCQREFRDEEEFKQVYYKENMDMSEAEPFILSNEASPLRRSLEDVVNNLDETFSEMVLRLIDEKGKTDVEVYKKANMDRKLFSKIRSHKDYNPKKSTAIALAIALELSLDETKDFLAKAGYILSMSHKSDVIVRYFIENKNYDIYEINEALFYFDEAVI